LSMGRKLTGYLAAVEDVSHRPRNTYRFVVYVTRTWGRLAATKQTLANSPDRISRIVREVERQALQHPEPLTRADGRTDLLRAWTALLVEASERVQREEDSGDASAATARPPGGSGEIEESD
jgi:hypothetical protein